MNLIQDTLAALALATDPPRQELLERKPDPRGASLISFNMWKMIFGQSIVQLAVIFTLNFAGSKLFPDWDDPTLKTVVFNTFVWLQFLNEINCRRIDGKLNVFAGLHHNPMFIIIMIAMIASQVLIIFVGGQAFSTTRLDGLQWLISICLGFIALPAGALVRLTPNAFIRLFIPKWILRRNTRTSDEERQIEDWDDALEAIRQDLSFFKYVRNKKRVGNARTTPTVSAERDGQATPPPSPNHSLAGGNSQLHPIRSASTLVPGMVALSMALPSGFHSQSSVVRTENEVTGG